LEHVTTAQSRRAFAPTFLHGIRRPTTLSAWRPIGDITSKFTLILTGMVVPTIHAEVDLKAASHRRTGAFTP
jgi:hypothetical protein